MDLAELIRQGKVKRIFRAKRKLTLPKLVSHITQRAAGKDPLFIEDSDYLFMLANLKDISKKRSLDVYAFCLMPNHIHLLVSPREDELNEPMRDLFHNQNAPSSFVKPGFVLALLSNEGKMQKQVYTGLLEKSVSLVEEDVIEYANAEQKLKMELVRVFPSVFSGAEKSKQISQYTGLDLLDEKELDQRINAFKTGSPTISPESKKARRFLIEQLIARGYKRDEIAARLGMSVKTVYNILKATV